MRFIVPDDTGHSAHEFDLEQASQRELAAGLFAQQLDDGRSPITVPNDSEQTGRRIESLDDLRPEEQEIHFLAPWAGG